MREKIVTFIAEYHARNGYAPSLKEIGDGVGLASVSSVMRYMYELRDRGVIAYADGIARTVRVVA